MRAILIGLAAVFCCALGLSMTMTPAAHAATTAVAVQHPAPVSGTARATNPCPGVYFFWEANVKWRWEVEMTSDPSAICVERGSLQCASRIGNTHWFHGGWVHSLNRFSGVNCSGAFSQPVQGDVDWSADGGTRYVYKTLFVYTRQRATTTAFTPRLLSGNPSCLAVSTHECQQSQGTGKFVTVGSSGWANLVYQSTADRNTYKIINGSGHCQTAEPNVRGVFAEKCHPGDRDQWFLANAHGSPGRISWESVGDPGFWIGVYGTRSGSRLKLGRPETGFNSGFILHAPDVKGLT